MNGGEPPRGQLSEANPRPCHGVLITQETLALLRPSSPVLIVVCIVPTAPGLPCSRRTY